MDRKGKGFGGKSKGKGKGAKGKGKGRGRGAGGAVERAGEIAAQCDRGRLEQFVVSLVRDGDVSVAQLQEALLPEGPLAKRRKVAPSALKAVQYESDLGP